MMRQNLFSNLKTLGKKAFGSVCSFAPIAHEDSDKRYEENIYGISGRLRC